MLRSSGERLRPVKRPQSFSKPAGARANEAAVSIAFAYLNMTVPPIKATVKPAPHAVAKARRWTSLAAAVAGAHRGAKGTPAARKEAANGVSASPTPLHGHSSSGRRRWRPWRLESEEEEEKWWGGSERDRDCGWQLKGTHFSRQQRSLKVAASCVVLFM
ncbi:unnamed protein product [Urochloa humidicola]